MVTLMGGHAMLFFSLGAVRTSLGLVAERAAVVPGAGIHHGAMC